MADAVGLDTIIAFSAAHSTTLFMLECGFAEVDLLAAKAASTAVTLPHHNDATVVLSPAGWSFAAYLPSIRHNRESAYDGLLWRSSHHAP
jgi:hypothetical protein